MAQPDADIELEDLRQQPIESDQETWYDASESPPAQLEAGERGPSMPLADASDEDASEGESWIRSITSLSSGTWVGVAVGGGAFIVAIYYGFLSLRMQKWTTFKDFRDQCRDAKVYAHYTIVLFLFFCTSTGVNKYVPVDGQHFNPGV
jgi:hypothetical protein